MFNRIFGIYGIFGIFGIFCFAFALGSASFFVAVCIRATTAIFTYALAGMFGRRFFRSTITLGCASCFFAF